MPPVFPDLREVILFHQDQLERYGGEPGMRVRTTDFYGGSMLTRDTVPVEVDAIAFWYVGTRRRPCFRWRVTARPGELH